MKLNKFKYGELAFLSGTFKLVKVGVKFDSKIINKRRNISRVSYYISGYETRDWCFEEELSKVNIIHKLLYYLIVKNLVNNIYI